MKFYSVKEIADLVGVSKPTVAKQIKEAMIDCDEVHKGKQLYNLEHTKQIISRVNPFFDLESISELGEAAQNAANEREAAQNQPPNAEKQAEISTKDSQTAEKVEAEIVALLRSELERKNKEIDELKAQLIVKDERIDRLYQKIEEYSDKAMFITAADKTAVIMDKSQPPKEDTKKHWFTFWKR